MSVVLGLVVFFLMLPLLVGAIALALFIVWDLSKLVWRLWRYSRKQGGKNE